MNWIKRIALFIALNLVVITTIGLLLHFFNVQPYLTAYGLNYKALLIFCSLWGMIGSGISLLLSRKMAKWMLGVRLLDSHHKLYQIVARLAKQANLPATPEVGIFHSRSPNAFATGPSKRRSLVAVSDALLEKMPMDQVEAVIGHELAHIKNGDMVTMTLLQGVVNAFVMFFARVAAFALNAALSKGNRRSRGSNWTYILTVYLFEIVFMMLGSLITCGYSRYREYRADAGGAKYAGKSKMIAALQSLQRMQVEEKEQKLAAFMIASPEKCSLLRRLYSTHPPLESRIMRLQELRSYEFAL